jgi:hypothetical protein
LLEGVIVETRKTMNRAYLQVALLRAGGALIQLQRWDEAGAALTEAEALVEDGVGDRNSHALVQATRATLDSLRGDIESADQHWQAALQLAGYRTKAPGRSLLRVLLAAADVAISRNKREDGERFAQDALALAESVARGPDTSADVGEALLLIARARHTGRATASDHAALKATVQRAIRCLSNGLGPDHTLTLQARNLVAAIGV